MGSEEQPNIPPISPPYKRQPREFDRPSGEIVPTQQPRLPSDGMYQFAGGVANSGEISRSPTSDQLPDARTAEGYI